jgi:DNA repair photolyase
MALIYEPSGKAREYSALALNVYSECDHACSYCYVPSILRRKMTTPQSRLGRNGGFRKLEREAEAIDKNKRILLSFMCDPYCHADVELADTREALSILRRHGCTVSILSKGGRRVLRDLDLFDMPGLMVGATLVFANESQRAEIESNAAPTRERIDVLQDLHDRGITTWASFEPVYDPEQSLQLMNDCLDAVDVYKVGKLNHHKSIEAEIDWASFGTRAVELLRTHGKQFYIKNDLAKHLPDGCLRPEERDPDRW